MDAIRTPAISGAAMLPVNTRTAISTRQSTNPSAGMKAGISKRPGGSPARRFKTKSEALTTANAKRSRSTVAEANSATPADNMSGVSKANRIRIATWGVWRVGWIRPTMEGSSPWLAIPYNMRDAVT